MDHATAQTLMLAEKYLLDDMSELERGEFEEHLFECPICSDQVRQNFTIIENIKDKTLSVPEITTERIGWRRWFQLPSLVPTFAALALACIVGYRNFGVAPDASARLLPQIAVLQPVTKGSAPLPSVKVDHKSAVFQLSVNADTLPPGSFTCEILNSDRHKIVSLSSGPQNTAFDLQLQLPTKSFPSGKYQLLLRPVAEPDSILTYPFAVEDN